MSLQITNITDPITQKPSKQLLESNINQVLKRQSQTIKSGILNALDKERKINHWNGGIDNKKVILLDEEIADSILKDCAKMIKNNNIDPLNSAWASNRRCSVIVISNDHAELTLFPTGVQTEPISPFCEINTLFDSGDLQNLINNKSVLFSSFTIPTSGNTNDEYGTFFVMKDDIKDLTFFKENDEKMKEMSRNLHFMIANHYRHTYAFPATCYIDFQFYFAYLFSFRLHFENCLFDINRTPTQHVLNQIVDYERRMIILKTIACTVRFIQNLHFTATKWKCTAYHRLLDLNSYLCEKEKVADEEKHKKDQEEYEKKQQKKYERINALANGQYATGLFIGGVYAPSTNKYIGNGQQSIMSTNMGGYLNVGGLYMI